MINLILKACLKEHATAQQSSSCTDGACLASLQRPAGAELGMRCHATWLYQRHLAVVSNDDLEHWKLIKEP
jgi:hypothetical protein